MKKIAVSALLMCFIICFAACGESAASTSNDITYFELETPASAVASAAESGSASDLSNGDIDVDLTLLSSTMVYSEVYNMMNNTEDYIGKRVKMRGEFNVFYNEDLDKNYYTVLIADATACCQQGLEFIWSGEHTYPDDYPAEKSEIEVTGVFGLYDELGIKYFYLDADSVKAV